MKANPTEKKVTAWSGSSLIAKILFLLVVVPVSIPAIGWLLEAFAWRYLLCRIDGIDLMGGLLEAFALSMVLGTFCACGNLLLAVVSDGIKRLKKIPLVKSDQRKHFEIKGWADLYKDLPGFRHLLQHFALNAVGLAFLSSLQPLRLHFDGAFGLFLSAGILSVVWIFCMTVFIIAVYILLFKVQRAKAAAGSAVV